MQKWILGFACFCMDCHATAIALARNDRKKAESVKVDSKENAQDSVIASFAPAMAWRSISALAIVITRIHFFHLR